MVSSTYSGEKWTPRYRISASGRQHIKASTTAGSKWMPASFFKSSMTWESGMGSGANVWRRHTWDNPLRCYSIEYVGNRHDFGPRAVDPLETIRISSPFNFSWWRWAISETCGDGAGNEIIQNGLRFQRVGLHLFPIPQGCMAIFHQHVIRIPILPISWSMAAYCNVSMSSLLNFHFPCDQQGIFHDPFWMSCCERMRASTMAERVLIELVKETRTSSTKREFSKAIPTWMSIL